MRFEFLYLKSILSAHTNLSTEKGPVCSCIHSLSDREATDGFQLHCPIYTLLSVPKKSREPYSHSTFLIKAKHEPEPPHTSLALKPITISFNSSTEQCLSLKTNVLST